MNSENTKLLSIMRPRFKKSKCFVECFEVFRRTSMHCSTSDTQSRPLRFFPVIARRSIASDSANRRTWAICTRRAGKLYKARSRLYRSHILQVNMRWKALAEIYTMHSLAPFWNPQSKTAPFWNRIPKNEENHKGKSTWTNPPFYKLNVLFENRQKVCHCLLNLSKK